MASCTPCKTVPLHFRNHVYKVRADMRLVADIESELGAVGTLKTKFASDSWKVSDLVSLTHMMLAACGKSLDYMQLGDLMMQEGLEKYKAQAVRLLDKILGV